MNSNVVFVILVLAFICGDNVLAVVGYPHHDFSTSIIFRLHPLTYLAFGLLFYYLIVGHLMISDFVNRMKNELMFLSICFITICYLAITNNLNAISFFMDALILPVILSILLKLTDKQILGQFRNTIYIFFFINAFIAFIEKIRGVNLIQHESPWQFDFFRSSAIFGHPLNNALIMSILTIILFFGAKNTWLRIGVLCAGMISIFCFGARGGLIGVLLGIVLNILLNIIKFKKGQQNIINGLLYLALLGITIFLVINYTELGNRIAALSYMDTSAEARVNTYNIFQGVHLDDLWLGGYSTAQIDYLQYLSGVEIIENFYIVWVLRFGIIITAMLIISLIKFLFSMMSGVTIDIKLPILVTFFFVASTNNSLATNTLSLSIVVLAYYVLFESKNVNHLEHQFIIINS